MTWTVQFHPDIQNDFRRLGRTEARKIEHVIKSRIKNGEPDKIGKPLSGELKGYRRLRTGQTRIVYRVDNGRIEVLIIAVGIRRDDEVYEQAQKRV